MPGSKSNRTKASSQPPASAGHRRSPLSKTNLSSRRRSGNERAAQEMEAAGVSRCNKIHTFASKDNTTMIASPHDKDGGFGYFRPLETFCEDPKHDKLVRDQAKIHKVCCRRSPNDPQDFLFGSPTKSGHRPKQPLFLGFLDEHQIASNTAATRARWGTGICTINNSPHVQQNGCNNQPGVVNHSNRMEFAGDITPAETRFLSDYLTIGDIMDCIADLYARPDPDTGLHMRLSNQEIIEDSEILELFFSPDLIPLVKEVFAPTATDDVVVALPDLGLEN